MVAFIARRLVVSIPVLIGILAVTFILGRLIPGDPCVAMLGEHATKPICDAYKERMGLNEPIVNQFVIYAGTVLQGNLGSSLHYQRPVTDMLVERLPVTLELTLAAMLFAIVFGIPLGIISAYRHNTAVDVGTMIGANVGVSMPVFWLGLMLAYLFGVILKGTPLALPSSGRLPPGFEAPPFFVTWGVATQQTATGLEVFISRLNLLNAILTLNGKLLINALRYLILPAVAVGTIPMSIIARMTRSSVLETLGQDYVRTARSKGLREFVVVMKHAVRNALLPIVTVIGLNFGGLVSGAVLTETIFGLTGVGRTLVDGIFALDYPVVQGFTLVIAVAFVVINLAVDMLYGYLDPRIRVS